MWRWMSICSAHIDKRDDCPCCQCGHWQFIPFGWLSSAVYYASPGLWRWFANLPFSPARRRLRKWFPNLK